MDENEILTLTDENGDEIQLEFIDIINYKDEEYGVFLPPEGEDNDDGVIIFRIEDDDNDEEFSNYCPVEDEKILTAVFDIFKERYKDVFDFSD